ncbi:MAG: hypothetical protein QOD00_3860 [Blastocatellia bacterium]|nr:hypothetical protein [Blastocatellia bacterium]
MGKRHRKKHQAGETPPSNSHYENLVKLREDHPQAYERLGEETHQNVEEYEMSKFAATFEFNPGNESLLDLSLRLPEVFALLNQNIRDEVERYGASKRAHQAIYENEEEEHSI